MSGGSFDGQNYPSGTSHSPEAPIRKKRQMSLHGPSMPGDLPPQPASMVEMTRRSSLQPVSGSTLQNLQGQLRIAPPLPIRSSTTRLPSEVPGPYRAVVVPPVTQSPPKPLRKDQVYMFEFACENKSLGIALGIGHHDPIHWKSTVQGNGIVYQRKENGDYFQVEELSTAQDFGLRRGDEVLSINGCMLYKYSLDYAGILLAEAASCGHVTLAITRPKRPPSRADYSCSRQSQLSESFESVTDSLSTTQSTTDTTAAERASLLSYSEPFNVDLYKEEDGKSLGIGIVGGVDAPLGPIGFFIKTIYPSGLVGEDGRLKTGDEIILLNGVPLQGLRHSEAINKFKLLPSGPVRLTVRSLVHLAGPSKPSSELKDSSQRLKNSADSHSTGSSSLFSENARSDSLLDEILLEYGKQDKLETDYADVATGKTIPGGNATHSSLLTETTRNSPLPIVSRADDALTSKIVISQTNARTSNMSVPNALVTDEEFQSPLVTDPGSYYETGYLDFYGNPIPDSGPIRPNVKEPELIVINLYQNPPAATEIAGERSDDDGLFSQETDFGVPPPPIKPGDILGSYLVTKKSSEASDTTAEYFDPPHEFTSTMYIADDSDEDGNGDAGSRSFQKDVGDDSHSAMAVAWSGMQNDDFLSGIGAPVGFGDDQRQSQTESQRKLIDNSKLPNRVESGTSEPLWKDFDLLGSDTQKLVTEESVFGVKAWSNSSHNSQTNTTALANGTSLNPFADGASFSNSNIFDSAQHEVFNVRNGAFGAEYGQRELRESTSDNSLQDTLSPYETGLSPDAEKWFSVESPDPGTSNVPQKRLILVGEIELAPPPPNFSGVKLNGGESERQHPEEHINEFSASSGFKEEEDVKTDRFNMRPALNSTRITSEKTAFSEVPPITIDSESSMTEKDACVDEADADAWLEACIPSGKHDSSASLPKLDNELFSHQETSRPEDPGTVPFSAGDHGATTVLSSSALPPPPPSLPSDYASSESFLDMSEPPPLPSSAPPPLPDTPPPPLTGHRYAYDLHLEGVTVSDSAPPPNNLFTDDFGAFNDSDFDPPAWKSDVSQELTYDLSHNSASVHDAHQHPLDAPGKASMTSTEFHGLPTIPKDQGSRSPWSSHQTFTGSLLSDQHSEFRAGSSKAPSLTAESEIFSSVADKPDFLSYSQPADSVNDQVKASSTSFSTSQADVATFGDQVTPEEGNKTRSETEPFQVKVNKNLWGLGMTVSVTAKGAVITDIQAMSPVGKIGDIRVNDYLLAVNGIRIGNQRTEEIQEILSTLPSGIVRLTVSALPPTSASYDQEQFENQRVDGKRMTEAQNATPSQDISYQMKSLSSPYVDLYAASPISTPTSASITDALSISRRSISRDEIVGSVLKDYYTVADKPKEETSNKPKKPLIAQALLPKSKRSGSLVPGSASSTPDAKTSRSSLSSASSHSECLDALNSERKPSEDVANNSVFEEPSTINFPVSKDLVTPISSSWSLKTKRLAFEEGDADESSTKEQTKPADQSKISESELQFNMGRYAKGVDIFEKEDDDSASVQSDSSSIHSAGGYSSQSSENSALSRSRVLAEVETEYAKKVASSKAFFQSIQADSKKAPSSKQSGSKSNRTSEVTPRSTDFQLTSSTEPKEADNDGQDLMLKSESVTPLRETPVDSENLNIAESKAFFKSIENSKKQSGSSRNLPDTPVQTSVSYEAPKLQRESRVIPEVDLRMIPEAESVSEFQCSGKNMSSGVEIKQSLIENEHSDMKLRETREVLDSESINVADSKAFFKSMESTSKRSSKPVSKATQNLPVIGSKTGIKINANAEPKGFMARKNEGRAEEFPKFIDSSEPETSNEKMQEMKQKNSDNETHQVELIKVTETKAFFESLKPPTSSADRDKIKPIRREESLDHSVFEKLNTTAQETVSSAAELKSQPPGGTPNQSSLADLDKPRAVVQPVSRKESASNVSQHTTGRLPTLPSQKYLPVPPGPLPKLSPTSSAVLRPPHKTMPLVQGSPSPSVSSTPQTPDAPKERKDISVNSADTTESQEQQKSVGNLVSKFATFSPEPKANFSGELKPDTAMNIKRESPGQVRYQYGGTGDSSKSPAADSTASPASADAWKMKRPIPPSGPPPSATTPSQSASPMPVIGSNNKSQKWKQFMTNYSSMK